MLAVDPEDEPADPMSLNRILLLRCINHLTHLIHVYGEVRRTPLPFDVRMILQRHHLRNRETLETFVVHVYCLSYPTQWGASLDWPKHGHETSYSINLTISAAVATSTESQNHRCNKPDGNTSPQAPRVS